MNRKLVEVYFKYATTTFSIKGINTQVTLSMGFKTVVKILHILKRKEVQHWGMNNLTDVRLNAKFSKTWC